MSDLYNIAKELSLERGGFPEDYMRLASSMRMDYGGRIKYKYGGKVAAKRTKHYLQQRGYDAPLWLDDDPSNFNTDQEDAMLLGYLRGNPRYENGTDLKAYGGTLERYEAGGTHEQNPLGGIPIGQSASVEEGETSFDVQGKKYVFSDRLDLANGGPTDPPNDPTKPTPNQQKTLQYGKDYMTNWISDPQFLKRYQENMQVSPEDAKKAQQKALDNINTTTAHNYVDPEYKRGNIAVYDPYQHSIGILSDKFEGDDAAHEYAHAAGGGGRAFRQLDSKLGMHMIRRFGALRADYKDFTQQPDTAKNNFVSYVNSGAQGNSIPEQGEHWAHLMQLRYLMNVQPGDTVSKEQIEKFLNSKAATPEMKIFINNTNRGVDEMVELMNTIADNSQPYSNIDTIT